MAELGGGAWVDEGWCLRGWRHREALRIDRVVVYIDGLAMPDFDHSIPVLVQVLVLDVLRLMQLKY